MPPAAVSIKIGAWVSSSFFPQKKKKKTPVLLLPLPLLHPLLTPRKSIKIFLVSSSSSSSCSSSSPLPIFKRSNSTHLHSRAQSTVSICALLIFVTLLLSALSTFETSSHFAPGPRRQLYQTSYPSNPHHFRNNYDEKFRNPSLLNSHALQGMGTLYRRGTKAMNGLVVAHVSESLNLHEFKLFLRLWYRSSLPSRSDLLFIFPSKNSASDFYSTILEENDSFLQHVDRYRKMNCSSRNLSLTQFVELSHKDKESGEPIWGRRIRGNFSEGNETESTRLSYGSEVSFDVDELDPENSLAGFLDHVPMSLRRWACYPLLLGRVRRNFKHIMLVDTKELLLTGDPLSRVRNSSPESVHLSMVTQSITTQHGKKNSEKIQESVNPAIIRGGMRGIRRLSNAMLIEIVRAALQRKKKNPVTESGLFNQLVGNEFLLKNVNLIKLTESIPELSSLAGSNLKPGSSSSSIANFTVARRGNNNF